MAKTRLRFVLLPLPLLIVGCAGGGGGGGGGGPVDPPTGPTAFTQQAGLAVAAPGPGAIRIDFVPPPSADFEVAVFVSTNRASLFSSAPHVPVAGATTVTVNGLLDGTQHFVGLGIRPTSGGAYQQTGPTLAASPGTPFFIDPSAVSGAGAGTLASPYSLFDGVLHAFAALLVSPSTSVNLWLREGSYTITSALPVAAGVSIYGGFGPAFDLATRDVKNTPSIWNVAAGQFGMVHSDEQLNAGLPVIVDGVRMTGNGVGRIGIDTNGTDPTSLELRSVIITDMADRGLRLRNVNDSGFDIVLTSCQSSRNGADGLSGVGAFDYSVYNCIFASNVQEGLDLSDLTAETGGVARMRVTSSQFFGNGAEGLDCTLGPPLFPNSASFEIEVRGCAFEGNALAGCLIDADFELVPGYSADVVVRESFARANLGHGFQFDLDGPTDLTGRLTAFAVGLLATGNGLDGIYISSESREGLTVLSTSAMIGNLGAGLRIEGPLAALGNRSVEATHCLFASNFGGGMISRDVSSSASSSIAYLQTNAFDANTVQVGNVSSNSPAALAFVNAPEEYARVSARSGAVLTLSAAPGFSTGAKLELADDGIERAIASIVNTQVTLSAAPAAFGTPGMLAAFAPGAVGVNENYDLAGGSIALAAGLGGRDAGPAGSPVAGRAGEASPEQALIFHPIGSTPEIADLVGNNESVVIEFSKTLNGASANAATVRARRGANAISITIQTLGAELTLVPPGGGWGAGDFHVELDGLTAGDGTALSGSVVLPFNR